MIHPDTELKFINKAVGYGVVAKKLIPKGTITWVQDHLDRIFSPFELQLMDPPFKEILENYTFRNQEGNHVFCWDHGRYINHSFHANCYATPYQFEIAVKNIFPGEQLTNDYGFLNITEPFYPQKEKGKRKEVFPDDLKRYANKWDKVLATTFPMILSLNQPLKNTIKPKQWEIIEATAKGSIPLKSILNNYFDQIAY